ARPESTGGTPKPQIFVNYLIRDPRVISNIYLNTADSTFMKDTRLSIYPAVGTGHGAVSLLHKPGIRCIIALTIVYYF
ncbi:hypothetical protein, partial [Microcoleus sp. F10-B2]|uniref:hypothetical protein n=1 Tax=Microcoleus sp. F10-B2 TaxID=2818751 RepID=UPI002FD16618